MATIHGLTEREIDGWAVEPEPAGGVRVRKGDRFLTTTGEAWMSGDALAYRSLQSAAKADGDDDSAARYAAMAEALVMRDRAAAARKKG